MSNENIKKIIGIGIGLCAAAGLGFTGGYIYGIKKTHKWYRDNFEILEPVSEESLASTSDEPEQEPIVNDIPEDMYALHPEGTRFEKIEDGPYEMYAVYEPSEGATDSNDYNAALDYTKNEMIKQSDSAYPQVITPEEWEDLANNAHYEVGYWTFWPNRGGGQFTDDDDPNDRFIDPQIVEREIGGDKYIGRIGEYEDGMLYIKNDRLGRVYEITLDVGLRGDDPAWYEDDWDENEEEY